MLAVTALFTLQSGMVIASQAAAALGVMPQPAAPFSGPVHIHDGLAGHMHIHVGNAAAGHVHAAVVDRADVDQDDDANGTAPYVSLCSTAAVMPAPPFHAVSRDIGSVVTAQPHHPLHGVEPGGLNRPPSSPDIA
jgi:hypothetical protein